MACTLFIVTTVLSLLTYLLFEAPVRSLFRYYFESPRTLSLILPSAQNNDYNGTDRGQAEELSYKKEFQMNPHFLFSPHYNMITNVSSRAESAASSVYNFPMHNNNSSSTNNTNKTGSEASNSPKHSVVVMSPNVNDLNNNLGNNNQADETTKSPQVGT